MTSILSKMEYTNDTSDANNINAIYAAEQSSLIPLHKDAIDANAIDCNTSSPVNFLYLSTIRGGRRMNGGCGCGMTGGYSENEISNSLYEGGCFTCKKGVKNIIHIYSSVHIIIPKLYNKYKNGKANIMSIKGKAINKAKK